jgi:hypothetical protein
MRRNVLAAATAVGLVAIGSGAVAAGGLSGHSTSALLARLESATRVTREAGGGGYWLVDSNGKVSTFGNAKFYGSMAGKHLKAPIIGIVATPDGRGYWLVAKDGGVFSFGDARFKGSLGDKVLTAPVVGMASSNAPGAAIAGPRGARGPAGARGARGAVGPAGARGPIGAKGPIGPEGAAGPMGPIGPAGVTGATGAIGPRGATGATGATGAVGPTGASGTSRFAEFFALMPPDNAATVASGSAVAFPQNGPGDGSGSITRTGPSTFLLSSIGTYNVSFVVSVNEPGQLELALNGTALAYTVIGRATGTSEIVGESLVATTTANAVLTVINPAGEASALTITPLAGGTHPVGASLVIQRLG